MPVRRGTSGNVKRPAQGNHTNDKYPVRIAAGTSNVNAPGASRAPKVNNNRKRGYGS